MIKLAVKSVLLMKKTLNAFEIFTDLFWSNVGNSLSGGNLVLDEAVYTPYSPIKKWSVILC